MYICICNAVNDKAINQAIDKGARSPEEIFKSLDITPKCGTCKSALNRMVHATSKGRSEMMSSDPVFSPSRQMWFAAE